MDSETSNAERRPGLGGVDGMDCRGNCTQWDAFPWLDLSGKLRPGSSITMSLDHVEQAGAFLFLSSHGGFANARRYDGAPWSVLPIGDYFLFLRLGQTDAAGDLSITAGLPNNPALQGMVLQLQAALHGASGDFLSNAVLRVIGE